MYLKIKMFVLFMGAAACSVVAQNFNYSIVKDSAAYSPLTGGTILTIGENFKNKSLGINLPFQFNFCGYVTDTLTVEGNGFILFDHPTNLALVAFNNFSSQRDTNNNYVSSISYLVEGSAGNRIVKIGFNNIAQSKLSEYDFLNYQVWISENGNKLELQIGANSYYENTETPQLVGLINRNMDSEIKATVLSGSSAAPALEQVSGEESLLYLNAIPTSGTIYRLIPSF